MVRAEKDIRWKAFLTPTKKKVRGEKEREKAKRKKNRKSSTELFATHEKKRFNLSESPFRSEPTAKTPVESLSVATGLMLSSSSFDLRPV